jgi:hypothetical protein
VAAWENDRRLVMFTADVAAQGAVKRAKAWRRVFCCEIGRILYICVQ